LRSRTFTPGSSSSNGPWKKSAALTATDEVSGQTNFRGNIGYTSRSSDSGINTISGVTGELDYRHALTGKTTAEIDLTRQINAYLTNDASEIDSAATLNVTWQATYRISMQFTYSYTYRQLPGQGNAQIGDAIVATDTQRIDRLNQTTLALTYAPIPWIILKPYVSFQNRTSGNFVGGNFNSDVIGLQFSGQWQRGVIPQRTSLNN